MPGNFRVIQVDLIQHFLADAPMIFFIFSFTALLGHPVQNIFLDIIEKFFLHTPVKIIFFNIIKKILGPPYKQN